MKCHKHILKSLNYSLPSPEHLDSLNEVAKPYKFQLSHFQLGPNLPMAILCASEKYLWWLLVQNIRIHNSHCKHINGPLFSLWASS